MMGMSDRIPRSCQLGPINVYGYILYAEYVYIHHASTIVINIITSHYITFQPVHGSLNIPANLKPIRSSFCKLVHLFGAENAVESIVIGYDGCEFFGIGWVNQVDL